MADSIVLATVLSAEDAVVPFRKADGSPADPMVQMQYTYRTDQVLKGASPAIFVRHDDLRMPGSAPPKVSDQDFDHHRLRGWESDARVHWQISGPGDCGLHPHFKAGAAYLLFSFRVVSGYRLGFEQIIDVKDDAWLAEVRRAVAAGK